MWIICGGKVYDFIFSWNYLLFSDLVYMFFNVNYVLGIYFFRYCKYKDV